MDWIKVNDALPMMGEVVLTLVSTDDHPVTAFRVHDPDSPKDPHEMYAWITVEKDHWMDDVTMWCAIEMPKGCDHGA